MAAIYGFTEFNLDLVTKILLLTVSYKGKLGR